MTPFIMIQVSDPIFWGYQYRIPRKYFTNENIEDILLELKEDLIFFLKKHNLQALEHKVPNFHIHQNIVNNNDIIYACSHYTCEPSTYSNYIEYKQNINNYNNFSQNMLTSMTRNALFNNNPNINITDNINTVNLLLNNTIQNNNVNSIANNNLDSTENTLNIINNIDNLGNNNE